MEPTEFERLNHQVEDLGTSIRQRLLKGVTVAGVAVGVSLYPYSNPLPQVVTRLFDAVPVAASLVGISHVLSASKSYADYARLKALRDHWQEITEEHMLAYQERRGKELIKAQFEPQDVGAAAQEDPTEDETIRRTLAGLFKGACGYDLSFGAREAHYFTNEADDPTIGLRYIRFKIYRKPEITIEKIEKDVVRLSRDISASVGLLNPRVVTTLGGVFLVADNPHYTFVDFIPSQVVVEGSRGSQASYRSTLATPVETSPRSVAVVDHGSVNVQPTPPVPELTSNQAAELVVEGRIAQEHAWLRDMINYPGVLIHGAQGSGKSGLARFLVRCKALSGHDIEVLDPHQTYGYWQGLTVTGAGMDYVAIDEALGAFDDSIAAEYHKLSTQKGYDPPFKTLVVEEITNYSARCKNAAKLLSSALSDIRKAHKCVLLIGYDRTLGAIGGAKNLAKARDNTFLELELFSQVDPHTGLAVPAGYGFLKYPGRDTIKVSIPTWMEGSEDFSDLAFEEFDEEYAEKYGVDPDEEITEFPEAPKTNPNPTGKAALFSALIKWRETIDSPTVTQDQVSKAIKKLTGYQFTDAVVTEFMRELGWL